MILGNFSAYIGHKFLEPKETRTTSLYEVTASLSQGACSKGVYQ